MNDLDRSLDKWRKAGIISAAQVDQIRDLEANSRPVRRIPLVAEVLGYLGAALVLTAVFALTADIWEELSTGVRILVFSVTTALLLGAGSAIGETDEPALRRLSNFLWLAAVGSIGFLFDEIATDALDVETGYALIIGSAMTGLALWLWLIRTNALQLLGVFGGLLFLTAGVADILGGSDKFGILTWLLGVAWLALARRDLVSPERTSYALGAGSMLFGAQWAAFELFGDTHGWAFGLGLISAVTLLALSVSWRSTVLLAFGTGGVFLFLPQITDEYLGDTIGGPSALLVAGVVLLGVAVMAVRLRDKVGR